MHLKAHINVQQGCFSFYYSLATSMTKFSQDCFFLCMYVYTKWECWSLTLPIVFITFKVCLISRPDTQRQRNLQFPHRVLFTKKKMPWCPCPFNKRIIQACIFLFKSRQFRLECTRMCCIELRASLNIKKTKDFQLGCYRTIFTGVPVCTLMIWSCTPSSVCVPMKQPHMVSMIRSMSFLPCIVLSGPSPVRCP